MQQPEFDQNLAMSRMTEFLPSDKNSNRVINEAAFAINQLVEDDIDTAQLTQLRDVMLRLTDALVTTHVVPKEGAVEDGRLEFSSNNLGGTSFTAGGGPQNVNRTVENESVLSALRKMTGENFGYNEDRWERYFIENFSLVDATVRTD